MKRCLAMIALVIYVFFCAISKQGELCAEQVKNQSVSEERRGSITEEERKALIIFYSRTGKTKKVSETISKTLGCTIQEIKDLKDRTGIRGYIGGMIDVRKNPITSISPKVVDLKDYDMLFIGSPIWGMKFAPAITTFLNSTDFKGKEVILFATTSARIKQAVIDEYSELINTKGGEVIDTFFIKTLWKDSNEIEDEAQKILAEKAGKWMHKLEKK